MSDELRADISRSARRWADAAWADGWHAHAFDVLDHAIRLNPDDFRLFRKRGAFHLICPDPWLQDLGRGFTDLLRACELSGWRRDLVEWASGLLAEFGDARRAEELLERAREVTVEFEVQPTPEDAECFDVSLASLPAV